MIIRKNTPSGKKYVYLFYVIEIMLPRRASINAAYGVDSPIGNVIAEAPFFFPMFLRFFVAKIKKKTQLRAFNSYFCCTFAAR